ncbi:MAG TPA: DNA primase, partial [Actinomycetota bacterium]|nr:DNA primase [Actinomycetota bacterium]
AYVELAVQPPEGEVSARLIADIFTRLKEMVLTRQIEEKKIRLQQLNPEGNVEEYHARFAELIELEAAKRKLTDMGEDR